MSHYVLSSAGPVPCRVASDIIHTPADYEAWLRVVLLVAGEVHAALKQMQAGGLMHRDVKPDNTLVFTSSSYLTASSITNGAIIKVGNRSNRTVSYHCHTSLSNKHTPQLPCNNDFLVLLFSCPCS